MQSVSGADIGEWWTNSAAVPLQGIQKCNYMILHIRECGELETEITESSALIQNSLAQICRRRRRREKKRKIKQNGMSFWWARIGRASTCIYIHLCRAFFVRRSCWFLLLLFLLFYIRQCNCCDGVITHIRMSRKKCAMIQSINAFYCMRDHAN